MNATIQSAVADAVKLVNAQPGQAAIRLMFQDGEPAEIDFIANSAVLRGQHFEFKAGIDTYGGSLHELTGIDARLINR